jgi:hypothetical protein
MTPFAGAGASADVRFARRKSQLPGGVTGSSGPKGVPGNGRRRSQPARAGAAVTVRGHFGGRASSIANFIACKVESRIAARSNNAIGLRLLLWRRQSTSTKLTRRDEMRDRHQGSCSRSSRIQRATSSEPALGRAVRRASISRTASFRLFRMTHARSASLIARLRSPAGILIKSSRYLPQSIC